METSVSPIPTANLPWVLSWSVCPATMELVAIAALLVLVIAIPLGVYAGAYPKRASSKIIMSGSILGISLPSFWVGMMMIYIFAVTLGKLPASGRGGTVDVLGVNLSIFAPGRDQVHYPPGHYPGHHQCGHHPAPYQIRHSGEHAPGLH